MTAPDRRIQRIVIAGGGSAGWMTAAALANALGRNASITLIESEEIGVVGVGEATIPPIKLFNQTLGIAEADFLRATQGTYKLGIQFCGWGEADSRYFHPFGSYGRAFDAVAVHQHWLRAQEKGVAGPLDAYCMAWAAASRNRFAPPAANPRDVLSTHDYAYHFDAGLYAAMLRSYAEARGVTRIEGRIEKVELASESGFVAALGLDHDRRLDGDLFIDCTGFRSLLLGEALGVEFEDWSRWLPCDRAIAVASPVLADLPPYTRSTAAPAGWRWRIPLQHRTGNGHVYASGFMSDAAAERHLMDGLAGEACGEPRLLRFTAGRRKTFWDKNVIAIGLSSGFMEPLESTSLHLIQAGIAKLLAFFPTLDFEPLARGEYNRVASSEFERIRDFLILHYKLNRREEPFWRALADMAIPDALAERIDHFRACGRLLQRDPDLFGPPSWLAVHVGQGHLPQSPDPLLAYRPDQSDWLDKVRRAMAAAAEGLPSHQAYIANTCRASQRVA
ncbi:MAG TPA: tryptophan halogenase family protein [Asticcacaulis sp.]|nr:tryptophan halogenase family protein [Asticcacaulis sp.]